MQWNVIGHEQQKSAMLRQVDSGTVAHAFLLQGPAGVGKRLFTDDVAELLLANDHIPHHRNPDAVILAPTVDAETGKQEDVPVETVRALKVWAYQRPLYGARKVVIIDDAERLSDAAANTLLKVIEEPPEYMTFLFVSSNPGSLLETIRSRCQGISFRTLSDSEMAEVLKASKLDADDMHLLATVAMGRPGAALSLIRAKRLPSVAKAIAEFETLLQSPVAERIVAAKRLADDSSLPEIVGWWLSWSRTQLLRRPQLAGTVRGLLDLSAVVAESKFNRRLALEGFWLSVV